MTRPKKLAPRLRRHRDAPANWQHRDGRPRWIPSPALRKAGWKGLDLKDGRGQWLTEGAGRDRATAINSAVADWRAGRPVPADLLAIAPPGADASAAAPRAGRGARDPLSIGALRDGWIASDDFRRKTNGDPRAASTQRDYRNKLDRFIDTLAGWVVLPARDDEAAQARYAADRADVLAQSIFSLEPVQGPDGVVDVIDRAYRLLRDHAGVPMGYGVMAVVSVFLTWARRRKDRSIVNWAADVSRETPEGKIRTRSWEEIVCMIRTADAMDWPSIGDSLVLGLDLSWSQVDRLSLTWDREVAGRCFTARQKTGRKGGTPLLEGLGLARLPLIRARQEGMKPRPTHILWCESTGQPWKTDHYRHVIALIRAKAAEEIPSLIDFVDSDLRDTAFTWAREAGLDDDGVASRTIQSRANVKALGDKHYGEIGPAIADPAALRLGAWLAEKGRKL